MRLVDPEELYEILCHDENHGLCVSHTDGYKDSVYFNGCGNDFLSIINKATTVDAMEVVHAQWVLADDGRLICNHCKSVKVAYEQLCYLRSTGCWNYCPNCGARMDGGN